LFDTPVLCSIPEGACVQTQYDLFVHHTPAQWSQIKDVRKTEHALFIRGGNARGDNDEEIKLQCGKGSR